MKGSLPQSPAGAHPEPLVSVIVRSMCRPTLGAALASIAMQDYAPLEVVIVAAAGSHPPVPGTGAVPVRIVSGGRALRRAAAANAGLDAARGEWITFLDDDDLFGQGHVRGMMAARERANSGVLHCQARSVFADGSPQGVIGHPHAPMELFERNYIHLSAAFLRRSAISDCRFDETLDILEDWDFFLQLAQGTTFHFVAQSTFVWHADIGTSGAGGGRNYDEALFARVRKQVRDKWRGPCEAMMADVTALLKQAQRALRLGDRNAAERDCLAALRRSQNHPAALNMLAIVRQAGGDLGSARSILELANAIRADDAALLHNLALVATNQGDRARAGACVRRALAVDPGFAPAVQLEARLRSERG